MMTFGRIAGLAAFGLALALGLGTAALLAGWTERHNQRQLLQALQAEALDWVEPRTDGLRATLRGEAPDEAARIRALRVAGTVVAPARIDDAMSVTRTALALDPEFRIEVMRHHDEISVIGLVPEETDQDLLLDRLAGIEAEMTVADMLQSASFPVPQGWAAAVDFTLAALALMPVAQLSVTPERIEVHALVGDGAQQAALAAQLQELAPEGLRLVLDLVAPRPVMAPYTLRFEIDAEGARLTACVAETEQARNQLLRAARAAGARVQAGGQAGSRAQAVCTLGLGAPSSRWGDAGALAIAALGDLGAGQVSIIDADVRLVVPHDIPSSRLDRVVARLQEGLPAVFVLQVDQAPAPGDTAPADDLGPGLTATLAEDGALLIEGRLPDNRIRNVVEAFARARFGAGAVTMETRLDPEMGTGWSARALTGLEALAELHHGTLRVSVDRLDLSGTSGNADAGTRVAGIVAEGLGPDAETTLRVAYDEALDPVAQAPTPERCEERINAVLADHRITFAPGSSTPDEASRTALDRIAEVLIDCGEMPFEVAGHTDSQGREATNLALSQARAEAVINALMARRVLVASLVPQGYGPAQPIASNDTEEGRETNRRIEFTLIRPEPEPEPIDPALEAELTFDIQSPGDDDIRPEPRPER